MTSQKAQTFTIAKASKHDGKKMNSHFAQDRNTNEGECSVLMVLYQKNINWEIRYTIIWYIICLCNSAHTKYLAY